jgi:hypothetical protein
MGASGDLAVSAHGGYGKYRPHKRPVNGYIMGGAVDAVGIPMNFT